MIKNIEALKKAAHDKAVEELGGWVDLCEAEDEMENDSWWKNYGGEVIGAGVGAIGGGLLGYYITDAVQKAELDKAEQAAIEEFMTNVGSKIQCYVGSELVGTYGQPVPTSME